MTRHDNKCPVWEGVQQCDFPTKEQEKRCTCGYVLVMKQVK